MPLGTFITALLHLKFLDLVIQIMFVNQGVSDGLPAPRSLWPPYLVPLVPTAVPRCDSSLLPLLC